MSITLRVKDVMDRKIIAVDASETVADAVSKMLQHSVWSVVVEERGLPQGVVTERDVIRRCTAKGMVPDKTPVKQIASSPLITIDPEATIKEAMDVMSGRDIRRLFVVDNGKIVGRVTQTELFHSTVSMMEALTELSSKL